MSTCSCYHHDGHEVFIDCVFSPTWQDGADGGQASAGGTPSAPRRRKKILEEVWARLSIRRQGVRREF